MLQIIQVHYSGKLISINQIASANNWKQRKAIVDRYKKIFTLLFYEQTKKPKQPYDKYKLTLEYYGRIDPTNMAFMVKIFEDTMQDLKYIVNDGPKNAIEIVMKPNQQFKQNNCIFTVEFYPN